MRVIQAEDRRALGFVALGYAFAVLVFLVLAWRDHRTLSAREVTRGMLVGPLFLVWPYGLLLVPVAPGLARPRSLLVAFGALALCAYLFIGFLACGLRVT
jgi:hypothetical protein